MQPAAKTEAQLILDHQEEARMRHKAAVEASQRLAQNPSGSSEMRNALHAELLDSIALLEEWGAHV